MIVVVSENEVDKRLIRYSFLFSPKVVFYDNIRYVYKTAYVWIVSCALRTI
jgi:hypothetical protein